MDAAKVKEMRDLLELIKECVSELENRINDVVQDKNKVVVILGDGQKIQATEVVRVDINDVDSIADLESRSRQSQINTISSNPMPLARSRAGWTPERRAQTSRRMRKWWKEQKRMNDQKIGH